MIKILGIGIGDPNSEYASLLRPTFDPKFTTMLVHDERDDAQAESHSAHMFG
jgi:hypothetical protein